MIKQKVVELGELKPQSTLKDPGDALNRMTEPYCHRAFATSRSMSQYRGADVVKEGFLPRLNKQQPAEEACWQFGSTSSLMACSSQYLLVQRDAGLENADVAMAGKHRDFQRRAEIELEWRLVVHEPEASTFGSVLSCLDCGEARSNNSLNGLCPECGGDTGSGESRSTHLFDSELLAAANCAAKKFDHWHVHESGRSYSLISLPDERQHITRHPAPSQVTSSNACLGKVDPAHVSFKSSSIGDQMVLPQKCSSAPQPPVLLPHSWNKHSFEDENNSWSTEINCLATPEKLGVALCHSQTRARNAEKRASAALIQKEELAKLFCREASNSRMYKTRGHLLELENLWLKTHMEVVPPFFKAAASSHCKLYRRGFAKDSAPVPSMMGLAFALGLSCASAGFMIGCCLGLIGLSH